ncbi:MAG TPA: hypothetical protein VL475_14365 [Planctomycetaceae bacterium]|nr:hypothetical protein [Planctomycetaceae bacterium]
MLTLSTSASLCGMYALYGAIVSPLVSPGPELLTERTVSAGEGPRRPPEYRHQAEEHLPQCPWAADAKYQIRNEQTYVYFQEWEKTEQSRRVRFEPFAMVWRQKDHDPKNAPITIDCQSAIDEFAENFDIANPRPGRIVGGALEGEVAIRGPEGMAIDGREFIFSEDALRVWSDNPVKFKYGPHSGQGHGLELALIPQPGPPDEDKPAVSGVRTMRLIKDVVMDLVSQPKENGAAGETVHVTSAGSFEYGVDSHVATFQKSVRVDRPTGGQQFDRLRCETLTIVFEPEKEAGGGAAAGGKPAGNAESTGSIAGDSKLQFRRLRAEGPNTTVVSDRSEMQARMQELTYDAEARIVALRDAKQVRMLQRNNELLCPEVTAMLDEDGQIAQATCRGAGTLFSYSKDSQIAPEKGRKRPIEFAAQWSKELRMEPDPATKLDLIEFTGQAVLSQPERMALEGDVVRLWVTPDPEGKRTRGVAETPGGAGENAARPRRMLALGAVTFASPQITGETQRLEVWFEDGPLPQPPLEEAAAGDRRQSALRPVPEPARRTKAPVVLVAQSRNGGARRRRASGKVPAPRAGLADVAPTPPAKKQLPRKKPDPRAPVKAEPKPPENPLHVVADRIRVKTMMDGDNPQVSEVDTEGRVHVTQEHGQGIEQFDLKGDGLHLVNYSEKNQVIHVKGMPAQVRDRGLKLEGADIHFDRGRNQARVEGPGALSLPVKNGFDGKTLEKPQLLDVFWQERMDFDGEVATFLRKVRTQLNGSEVRCEEMHVTLDQRISFADDNDRSQSPDTKIRLVVCRDGVDLKSNEYVENRLVQIRTAKGFEFALDQTTGDLAAQGPGTLCLWRRREGNQPGLVGAAGVKSNRGLQADRTEWEYTRIDFKGQMQGNSERSTTTFQENISIVYGPVTGPTDTIDADNLPKGGGWLRCDELELTQQPGQRAQPGTIAVVGRGNAELDGRSDHGLFHAKAARVSYDQSKGLFSMFGDGKRDATFWREQFAGSTRNEVNAQRMEFIPSRDELKVERASAAQGGR